MPCQSMCIAFTLEAPRLFSLIRPCLALLTLGPLGPFLSRALIYTLPRGSARYIFITLNSRPDALKNFSEKPYSSDSLGGSKLCNCR